MVIFNVFTFACGGLVLEFPFPKVLIVPMRETPDGRQFVVS